MNSWEIATRLVLALVLGGLIGLEREKIHQYAGFRIHILIALGACISAMVSLELVSNYNSADPSRIPGQVLTGIGFLGAGAILKTKVGVKGLTTAAGMWATACLGIAIGCGYYMLSILGWLSIVITLFLLRVGSELLFKNEKNIIRIKVEDIKLLSLICNKLEEERVMVKNINVEYCDSESWELILTVLHDRRIVFGIVANEIKNLEGIISIKCSE